MKKSMARREEYADTTPGYLRRKSVPVSGHGFFFNKMTDIAEVARVSPAPIYDGSGGKHCLLR